MINNKTYKKTAIGLVPSDWEVKRLKEIADVDTKSLKSDTNANYAFDYISLSDVDSEDFNIETSKQIFKTAPSRARRIVNKGDILMSTVRPNLQGFSIIRNEVKDLIASTGFAVITTYDCDNYFLYQYIFSNPIQKQFYSLLVGSNYPAINSSDVKLLKIPLPPLPEQQKIASILSTWDKAIDTCREIIDGLKVRNTGLSEKFLSGKIRLKGFEGEPKKEFHILGNFIKEVSVKNKDLLVKRVLSVTNSRGFINQSEQFEREVASSDLTNYKIVKKGQFAYNPSRVNVGSLDLLRNYEDGVLSPMYVVFETNNRKLLADFLHHHLKTYWFKGHIPMFVQGSVRDSLSFDGLCSIKFFIPSIEEQISIANILDKTTEELYQYQQKLQTLQLQKKGLMQQLLTGKVRVKT